MEGNLRIYGDIGYDWADDVENTASVLVSRIEKLSAECSEIVVHINSVGGTLYDGLPIFNALKNSKVPVRTVIDGCAMYMAGIIFQAGGRRSMCRSSILHIHSPLSFTLGNAVQMREAADMLDAWTTPLIAAIAARCGKTADQVRALWFDGKDHFFSPEQALEAGLIDDVYDAHAQFPEGIAPENIADMSAREIRDIYAKAYNKKESPRRLFGLIPIKNSKTKKPKNDMDTKELCARLGLNADAGEKDILDAIDRLTAPKDQQQDGEASREKPENEQQEQQQEQQQNAPAEDQAADVKALMDRIEALENKVTTAENELSEYRAAMNRGGGAPARSDFKKPAAKDEWAYVGSDKLFD